MYCYNFIRALVFALPYMFIILYFKHSLYILFLSTFHLLLFQSAISTSTYDTFILSPLTRVSATLFHREFFSPPIFVLRKWRQKISPICRDVCTNLHGVTYQKTAIFIFIAVRTLAFSVYITAYQFRREIGKR